jgi:cell wall-associated NlpC family hydrolase
MRRAGWLLLGCLVAALGVAAARAAAAGPPLVPPTTSTTATTTSPTTTTLATTTTATTTTTTTTAVTTTTTVATTSAQPTAEPKPKHRPRARTNQKHPADHSGSKKHKPEPMRPPPDFPPSPYPLGVDGGLTPAARENAVVSVASKYLGVRYKWGGATPKTGFDCSGLVMYVFAQLGVSLPHYAASQWYSPDAVWIPPDRLEPGDLVFFTGPDGTRESPGHVGIYVGDGYLIDAPHTGAFVRVDSLDERWFANKYVGAKRILGVSLDVRHLLHAGKQQVSATTIRADFPPPIMIEQPQASLAAAAIDPAAARTAPRRYPIWVGSVALGALFLLLLSGGLVVRRRRRPDAGTGASP